MTNYDQADEAGGKLIEGTAAMAAKQKTRTISQAERGA